MRMIEQKIVRGKQFRFYDGIDFDLVLEHPEDGSEGYMIVFVESFIEEMKLYNRDRKLKSVLNSSESSLFNTKMLVNDFVSIYQTDGIGLDAMVQIVKDKLSTYYTHNNDLGFDEFH